ncbi:MAG TPA: sugar phosphate nucleotidyltransferase, partial [bacterium]|nr:sugar phosphate nucleotidyltransferase [bacterium]
MSPRDIDAVILCGGRGTRLGNLTEDLPKPMLPVA